MAFSLERAGEEWKGGCAEPRTSEQGIGEGAETCCFAYEPCTLSSLLTSSICSQGTSSTCASYLTSSHSVELPTASRTADAVFLQPTTRHGLAHAPSAFASSHSRNAAFCGFLDPEEGAGSFSTAPPSVPPFSAVQGRETEKKVEPVHLLARSAATVCREGYGGLPSSEEESRDEEREAGEETLAGEKAKDGGAKSHSGDEGCAEEAARGLPGTQVRHLWGLGYTLEHSRKKLSFEACHGSCSQPCNGTKGDVPVLRVIQDVRDEDVALAQNAAFCEELQTSCLRLSPFLKTPALSLFSSPRLFLPRPSFASSSSPPSPISATFSSPSSSAASSSGRRDAETGGGSYILYLEPSPSSPLHRVLDDNAKKVAEIWGPDPAHCYPPHCSLSGFFTCTDIDAVKQSLIALFRATPASEERARGPGPAGETRGEEGADAAGKGDLCAASEKREADGYCGDCDDDVQRKMMRQEEEQGREMSMEVNRDREDGQRTLLGRAGSGVMSRETAGKKENACGEKEYTERVGETGVLPYKSLRSAYPKSFPSTPRERKERAARAESKEPRCFLGCVSPPRCQEGDASNLSGDRIVRRVRSERALHLIRSSAYSDPGEYALNPLEGKGIPPVVENARLSFSEPSDRETESRAALISSAVFPLFSESSPTSHKGDRVTRQKRGIVSDAFSFSESGEDLPPASIVSSLSAGSLPSVASSCEASAFPVSASHAPFLSSSLSPSDRSSKQTEASCRGPPLAGRRMLSGSPRRFLESPVSPHSVDAEDRRGDVKEAEEETLGRQEGKKANAREEQNEKRQPLCTRTSVDLNREGKSDAGDSDPEAGENEEETSSREEENVVISTEDGYVVLCLSSTCLSQTLVRLKDHLRDAAQVQFRMKAGDHVTLASHRSDPKTREAIKHFYQSAFFGSRKLLRESTWDVVLFQLEKKAKNYLTDGRHRFSEVIRFPSFLRACPSSPCGSRCALTAASDGA
ncbi:hypothetical protein TGVEG_275450 [Toxoplasma gondii VEG]|uniref:Uncharacterized protein n=1 Tax=Toxoplasma gondii (strain ATCC 50861 / VEG) TaxID=432359 RepID=B9QQF5_TOXGV|nr:hypothetical protein TGVEG_275450 [Toxoplasma gondii VEG]CEL77156.1 TPA: hypothetical protein BN1205_036540 [Toxoplasma gondii VEG]